MKCIIYVSCSSFVVLRVLCLFSFFGKRIFLQKHSLSLQLILLPCRWCRCTVVSLSIQWQKWPGVGRRASNCHVSFNIESLLPLQIWCEGAATSAFQDRQCMHLTRWSQTAGGSHLSQPCEIHVWHGPLLDFIHKQHNANRTERRCLWKGLKQVDCEHYQKEKYLLKKRRHGLRKSMVALN